jgi:hypothetical protein
MLTEAAGLAILAAIPPAFLVAPEPTTRRLSAFNGWLRRNGRMILACTPVLAALIVATNGLVGLSKKG